MRYGEKKEIRNGRNNVVRCIFALLQAGSRCGQKGMGIAAVPERRQKAIANYDEDPLTMASEAISNCLNGLVHVNMDALNFASTHYPFPEKQGAAMIACISDFSEEIATADFTHSMRAGASALKAALDAAGSGSAKNVMVAAADCRVGAPGSELEIITGDGSSGCVDQRH